MKLYKCSIKMLFSLWGEIYLNAPYNFIPNEELQSPPYAEVREELIFLN